MIQRADRKTVICHQTPNLRLTLTDKIKTCMFTKKKADDLFPWQQGNVCSASSAVLCRRWKLLIPNAVTNYEKTMVNTSQHSHQHKLKLASILVTSFLLINIISASTNCPPLVAIVTKTHVSTIKCALLCWAYTKRFSQSQTKN